MSCHCGMGILGCVSWLLTSIGAINWGLTYFRSMNLVSWLAQMLPAGSAPTFEAIVYGLIAVSGLLSLLMWFKFAFNRHESCNK